MLKRILIFFFILIYFNFHAVHFVHCLEITNKRINSY
jgi:hypothetical protein